MFRPTREETVRYAQEFGKLAEETGHPDMADRLAPTLERFAVGLFRLVVVGEIKKGKTSFINALLGEKNFLPVSSDVATSTVFKIHYGPERRFRIFFQAERDADGVAGATPPPLTIPAEELGDYGTEDGNPDNGKKVDFISVETPHPLLKAGLAIIDTPGLGGLFRKHADITWRYIPNADAVFFVLDSVEAVMTRDETEFLKRLREFTSRVFFVQTKIDAVEEEQGKAWAERNRSIIAEALGVKVDRIPYFPISAHLKIAADRRKSPVYLQRSGFLPLLEFLNHRLLPAKESLLGREVLQEVAMAAEGLRKEMAEALRIARTGDREKLDALEKESREAKSRFIDWEQRQWPSAMEKFHDGLTSVGSWAQGEFARRFDASPTGPLVTSIIDGLRTDPGFDARKIDKHVAEIQSACVNQCASVVFDIQEEGNKRIKTLIGETIAGVSEELNKLRMDDDSVHGPELLVAKSLNMHFSAFETVRNGLYGGMAGGTLATVALGAAKFGLFTFSIPFTAPIAVAAGFVSIGFIMTGVYLANRDKSAQQKTQAFGQLQQLLSSIVQRSHQQGVRQFMDNLTSLRQKIRDQAREVIGQSRKTMENRLLEISNFRSRSVEETKTHALFCEQCINRIDALLLGIEHVCVASASQVIKNGPQASPAEG